MTTQSLLTVHLEYSLKFMVRICSLFPKENTFTQQHKIITLDEVVSSALNGPRLPIYTKYVISSTLDDDVVLSTLDENTYDDSRHPPRKTTQKVFVQQHHGNKGNVSQAWKNLDSRITATRPYV
jgi:hypothetical protein